MTHHLQDHPAPLPETMNGLRTEVRNIDADVAEIKTDLKKVSEIVQAMQVDLAKHFGEYKNLPEQVSQLQAWRNYLAGGIAVLSLVIVPLAAVLVQQLLKGVLR